MCCIYCVFIQRLQRFNMNRYCSVPHCTSWAKRNPELTFHLFPEAGKQRIYIDNKFQTKVLIDKQKAWALNLKIGKPVTKFMRVCSLHFTESDYFYREKDSVKRKLLKRNALPSQKLPLQVDSSASGSSNRAKRIIKRRIFREKKKEATGDCDCSNVENTHTEEDIEAAECLVQLLQGQPNYIGPKTFQDFGIKNKTIATNKFSIINSNAMCL